MSHLSKINLKFWSRQIVKYYSKDFFFYLKKFFLHKFFLIIYGIKPVKNKSKFDIGYRVINPSKKRGILGMTREQIFLRHNFFTPNIFLRQHFFTPTFFYAKIIFYAKNIFTPKNIFGAALRVPSHPNFLSICVTVPSHRLFGQII